MDIVIGLGVIGVLMIMIFPLPPMLMDLLLASSITLGLIILLAGLYAMRPLDFSVFPTLLLLATLYRLSLNVATTRLILLHGHEGPQAAGRVIQAFGEFVVGGNYVVGFIIFLILVVINFVVITRGAGRVAEVGARFTLDAMPGKQMSIDADLNAGLINEDTARQRRREIEQQADFYGAMDGASKFVRGDAVAGLIITAINIAGGLLIGIWFQGMDVVEALRNYTLLTVGDGLVTQMPALIISTSAGIIVTRASASMELGSEIVSQLLMHPRVLGLTSGLLVLMAIMPGLPTVAFLCMGAGAGVMAVITRRARAEALVLAEREAEEVAAAPPPERIEDLLPLDILELEVGYGLISLVDRERNGELLERIQSIRRQLALELGIIVPPLHIRDNLQLSPSEYSILIKGIKIAGGELMTDHFLAMDPGTVETPLQGIDTTEPAFGLPAVWIRESQRENAQLAGYTVVDLSTVIATHLTEVIRRNAHELLGRQETQRLLDNMAKTNPKLVEEVSPERLPLGVLQNVLRNLLREQVSIRDLKTILETLSDAVRVSKDVEILTEYVRQALSRSITRQYQTREGTLPLLTLDPGLEQTLQDSLQRTEHGAYMALDPNVAQLIISQITEATKRFTATQTQPVLLCGPAVRSQLQKLTSRFIPGLVVLSHSEIEPTVNIQSLGSIALE